MYTDAPSVDNHPRGEAPSRRQKEHMMRAPAAQPARWSTACTVVLVIAGCGGGTAGPEADTSLGDILAEEDPALAYRGQTVVVSAEIDRILSPTAFTIAGTDATSLPAVLVVTQNHTRDLETGEIVQVTGAVDVIDDQSELQDLLGLAVSDNVFDEYRGDPLILADEVDSTLGFDG